VYPHRPARLRLLSVRAGSDVALLQFLPAGEGARGPSPAALLGKMLDEVGGGGGHLDARDFTVLSAATGAAQADSNVRAVGDRDAYTQGGGRGRLAPLPSRFHSIPTQFPLDLHAI
jgi:hypothetical protein